MKSKYASYGNYKDGRTLQERYFCSQCGNTIHMTTYIYGSGLCKLCAMSKFRNPIKYCIQCNNEISSTKNKSGLCRSCATKNQLRNPENHPNWQGGISTFAHLFYTSKEYQNWRESVFKRDKYTCQVCESIGHTLNAHHIKTFNNYPKLRLDINNGITLCKKCHKVVQRRN